MPWLPARDPERSLCVPSLEPFQAEVAQVADQERPAPHRGLGRLALGVAVSAGLHLELGQLPGAQVPGRLNLHGGLAAVRLAAAAGKFGRVVVGHGDGGAIADLDGGELLQQGDGDRVGRDRVLQHVFQTRSQEGDEFVGEALLDRHRGHGHAQLGGGRDEVVGLGVGGLEHGQDHHLEQRCPRELPLALDDTSPATDQVKHDPRAVCNAVATVPMMFIGKLLRLGRGCWTQRVLV